jgi:hypothetical protein
MRRLSLWNAVASTSAFIVSALSVYAWQTGRYSRYADEMQNPAPDPPDAHEKTEYAFARLRYRSPGGWRRSSWGTDSNKAEQHFVQGIRRLTRVHTRSSEEVIDIDDDVVYDWPWLYAVEVGHWEVTERQAKRLRDYLDRGGFLMVDDFHGSAEWEVFVASLNRIFPDRPIVDLDGEAPIFHTLYDIDDRVQVPGRRFIYTGQTYERDGIEPRWRAIYDDKGRVQVAICHNMDLGDAWEWADDPHYPERFASVAYKVGINYLVYAMTH